MDTLTTSFLKTVREKMEEANKGKPLGKADSTQLALLRGLTIITSCLLYTSDAADERSSVDLGGRRIIKKKKKNKHRLVLLTK
mgnify:CR=1 FL=1